MGTTAEKLQAVKASKEAIREALEAKGVQIGDIPLADYAVKIGEIEVERTSLNLDLKAIYDRYPEEPVRAVVQIKKNDLDNASIVLPNTSPYRLSKVITSDGAVYTNFPVTHTWDTSKDIPVDYPYPMQTRWLVICAPTEYALSGLGSISKLKEHIVAMYSDLSEGKFSGLGSAYFISYGDNQKSNSYFTNNHNLFKIPPIITAGKTDFKNMFSSCYCITTIPIIDTTAAIDMSYMFASCVSLRYIPRLETRNVVNMERMFMECKSIAYIPDLDMNNVTTCQYMFLNCINLRSVGKLQTYNCENFDNMFLGCDSLVNIDEINLSSATSTKYMTLNCKSLKYIRFVGIISLSLSLSYNTSLDKDSIMSAINALKDLTGETSQTLTLGGTNLNKLTDEQKAIATAKNWILN